VAVKTELVLESYSTLVIAAARYTEKRG